jgi:hypothetical protein
MRRGLPEGVRDRGHRGAVLVATQLLECSEVWRQV